MKKALLVVVLAIAGLWLFLYLDRDGRPEAPGTISGKAVPQDWLDAHARRRTQVAVADVALERPREVQMRIRLAALPDQQRRELVDRVP